MVYKAYTHERNIPGIAAYTGSYPIFPKQVSTYKQDPNLRQVIIKDLDS